MSERAVVEQQVSTLLDAARLLVDSPLQQWTYTPGEPGVHRNRPITAIVPLLLAVANTHGHYPGCECEELVAALALAKELLED